jgi:hypothetical protein
MGRTSSRPTPFAVVRHGSAKPPRVDLRSLDPRLDAGPIPGVADAGLLPSAASGGDATAVLPKSWHRVSARAVRASARVGAFLGMRQPVEVDGSVCIDDRGQPVGFARSAFGQQSSFVHLEGARTLPADSCRLGRVDVITGTCLFGGRTLRVFDESGADFPITHSRAPLPARQLVRIHADDDLSLYEWESALRLCRTVADLIGALPIDVPVAITVDIPRVQYHCYLLDAYRHRLVSAAMVGEWFDLVDTRHRRLSQIFVDLLRDRVADRRSNVTVEQSDSLRAVEPYLRAAVNADAEPRLDEMIGLIGSSASADSAWAHLLTATRPATVRELVNASYVSTPLRAVMRNHTTAATLTVEVENFGEWPILNGTRGILERLAAEAAPLRRPFLLGLYPLQQVMVTDERGRLLDPYCHDPGRYAFDAERGVVDLMSVIESVYGSPRPRTLTTRAHPDACGASSPDRSTAH